MLHVRGRRVQGRYPLQTSDAVGAAAVQIGPDTIATAAVLNKQLGLSFGQNRRCRVPRKLRSSSVIGRRIVYSFRASPSVTTLTRRFKAERHCMSLFEPTRRLFRKGVNG